MKSRGLHRAIALTLRGIVTATMVAVVPGSSAWAQRTTDVAAQAAAVPVESSVLATLVTAQVRDVSVRRAIDVVSAVSHVRIGYRPEMVNVLTKRVSFDVTRRPLGAVVDEILAGTGVELVVLPGAQLALRTSVSTDLDSLPEGSIVHGTVIDSATGQRLSGVTVKVAGTKLATTTQDSGRFVLRNVPTGQQILTAKIFGYHPAERMVDITAAQMATVRIVLVAVPTVLSGVVTTATGLQRKIEIGNDITSLNVDSIMRTAPITSVTDLLDTRVPGLTVLHSSGTPGDPARLRLRGAGSIQLNNDPIVIIDGVRVYASQSDARNQNLAGSAYGPANGPAYAAPSPLDQIDPNSIETIDVFKGPSASALYGSDAANGVIVITSKHGHVGPSHWTLGFGSGVNWLPGNWPVNLWRFGSSSYASGIICMWFDRRCTVDSLVPFQALNDPRFTVLNHGSDQTANLMLSGGVSNLQYSLSGSASQNVGLVKMPGFEQERYRTAYGSVPNYLIRPDNYNTWGVNGSLAAQPIPQANVTLQSSLFSSTQQRSSLQSAIESLGSSYINAGGIIRAGGGFLNPNDEVFSDDVERVTAGSLTSTNVLSLHWQPRVWLPLDATAGLSTVQRTDETYIPFGVVKDVSVDDPDTTGSYGLGRGTSLDKTVTGGTAIPLFRRHITVAVGGNFYEQSIADVQAYTDQLAPGVSVPTIFGNAGSGSSFDQTSSNVSTYGWYIEPRFNFASRFFAAPGFRLDGGSGGSHSSGSLGGLSAFPKINFSYVAVDRDNAPPLWGFLSLLRPRFAFGFAGTQPGPVEKLRLFNVGDYILQPPGEGSLTVPTGITCEGVCLDALGNTQLRPERSTELEGGFDATLWRGRLALTFTQSNKTRHDAILSIPVAPSISGVGGQSFNIEKNIGVIRNIGTEMSLTATLLQSHALSWTVGANMTSNNSLVMRLNQGQSAICLGPVNPCQGTRVVAGYPLFGTWALPIVGFADENHNGIIEPGEFRLGDSSVYIGQPDPKYQMNLTSDLSFLSGRLSVHMTFAYQNGLTQENGSLSLAQLPNSPNIPLATQASVEAFMCVDAQAFEIANVCPNSGSAIGADQTVSTLRFNDLSINYELPKHLSNWFRVPRMTVALQGSNLGLRTNYRGKDPDVNAYSTVSGGDETLDSGQVPEPRTWWLRMTVGN